MKSLKSKANTGFPGDREVLTSVVKQDLREKMDTDLAARQKIIFCSLESQVIAARKYDSRQLCFTCLFIQAFSWRERLSTIILVSEYLAGAMTQCSAVEHKTAKSIGEMKNMAADSCAHNTFSAWLMSVSLIVTTATEVQNVAFGSETFSHSSARRKGKLRSTRKEYYCVLSEIMSMVSHILELHDLLLNYKDSAARTLQYCVPSKLSTWKFFMFKSTKLKRTEGAKGKISQEKAYWKDFRLGLQHNIRRTNQQQQKKIQKQLKVHSEYNSLFFIG